MDIKTRVEVKDVNESGQKLDVTIRITDQGIGISFKGFGEKTSKGKYEPVWIEVKDGVPYVNVWGDINQEDPTDVISLEDARLTNREGEKHKVRYEVQYEVDLIVGEGDDLANLMSEIDIPEGGFDDSKYVADTFNILSGDDESDD